MFKTQRKPRIREMVECSNPECTKRVEVKGKGKKNIYCSLNCRYDFSPVMQRVCEDNFRSLNRKALKALIEELIEEDHNRAGISVMLGITAKTLRLWVKKLGIKSI